MTFFEFNDRFPTEQAAINYFYKVRYNGVLTCPHCGAKVNLYRTARRKVCMPAKTHSRRSPTLQEVEDRHEEMVLRHKPDFER